MFGEIPFELPRAPPQTPPDDDLRLVVSSFYENISPHELMQRNSGGKAVKVVRQIDLSYPPPPSICLHLAVTPAIIESAFKNRLERAS
jgi:hypothetical protein